MLLLPDQLVSSYELAVVPKYFHSTSFNSKFCILLQVSAGLDINKDKINFCVDINGGLICLMKFTDFDICPLL